jgi:preprotein translocase subunit Sec61beta
MAKEERVSGPQSSTGIIRFYDADTGGPKLDPKGIVVFSVVVILLIKLVGIVVNH